MSGHSKWATIKHQKGVKDARRGAAFTKFANMIALAACGTVAIVRLSRQKGGRAIRALVLSGLFVVAGVTYAGLVIPSFDQQLNHHTLANSLDYPGMRFLAILEIVLDAVVAIPGLVLTFRQPRGVDRPTSLWDTGAPPA